jgi:hypothetical protein
MTRYQVSSSSPFSVTYHEDFQEAKRVFCDKANLQSPGTTVVFRKLTSLPSQSGVEVISEIATVTFSTPSFCPKAFFQKPAQQTVKIQHKLWRNV